jgi:hypothetical protein
MATSLDFQTRFVVHFASSHTNLGSLTQCPYLCIILNVDLSVKVYSTILDSASLETEWGGFWSFLFEYIFYRLIHDSLVALRASPNASMQLHTWLRHTPIKSCTHILDQGNVFPGYRPTICFISPRLSYR